MRTCWISGWTAICDYLSLLYCLSCWHMKSWTMSIKSWVSVIVFNLDIITIGIMPSCSYYNTICCCKNRSPKWSCNICSAMRFYFSRNRVNTSTEPRRNILVVFKRPRLPCGSASINKTFLPCRTSPAPKFAAVVVLPTPPFWFAIAITLQLFKCIPPKVNC